MKANLYISKVLAECEPMTRLEYNEFRGWVLPLDEEGNDKGHIVKDLTSGHTNWFPDTIFNINFKQPSGLTFGEAIEIMLLGGKVARKGWNGKGMWILLVAGTSVPMTYPGSAYYNAGIKETTVDSHIDMYTAGGTMQPGWLASQADILAQDWEIA